MKTETTKKIEMNETEVKEFTISSTTAKTLQTIFDYHYSAILRDVLGEIEYMNHDKKVSTYAQIIDFMTTTMNWPKDVKKDIF